MAVTVATINIPLTSTLNRTPRRRPLLASNESEWQFVTKLAGDTSNTFTFSNLTKVFAAEYYGNNGVLIAAADAGGIHDNQAVFTGTLGGGTDGIVIAIGTSK